jgi:hypothetical protein
MRVHDVARNGPGRYCSPLRGCGLTHEARAQNACRRRAGNMAGTCAPTARVSVAWNITLPMPTPGPLQQIAGHSHLSPVSFL